MVKQEKRKIEVSDCYYIIEDDKLNFTAHYRTKKEVEDKDSGTTSLVDTVVHLGYYGSIQSSTRAIAKHAVKEGLLIAEELKTKAAMIDDAVAILHAQVIQEVSDAEN